MICECPRTELRTRRIRGGGIQYMHQCLDCGSGVGAAVKHSDVSVLPPYWDESIAALWSARVQAERDEREAAFLRSREDRRAAYQEYLQTPAWRARRAKVLQRDRFVCQGCLGARAVEVHHTTYTHIGSELLFQLISLCPDCHEKAHGAEGLSDE